MDETAALALALAAVTIVFVVTKQQEQRTAAMIADIQRQKASQGLSAGDVAAEVGAGVATYFGGPAAGAAVLRASGKSL